MGKMKNIEIELQNSLELTKYMEHRITVLEEQMNEKQHVTDSVRKCVKCPETFGSGACGERQMKALCLYGLEQTCKTCYFQYGYKPREPCKSCEASNWKNKY